MNGGVKINKSALVRQYGCCWETIDRRLNPEKYKYKRKTRIYTSKLDEYKNLIDEKFEMMEKGLELGEKETNLKIVKKMLEKKMNINLISELTGLTKEEIESLL